MLYVNQSWSLDQLEQHVITMYPGIPLSLVGFTYARCLQGAARKLIALHPHSVHELKTLIKASRLYVIPLRELPDQTVSVAYNVLVLIIHC